MTLLAVSGGFLLRVAPDEDDKTFNGVFGETNLLSHWFWYTSSNHHILLVDDCLLAIFRDMLKLVNHEHGRGFHHGNLETLASYRFRHWKGQVIPLLPQFEKKITSNEAVKEDFLGFAKMVEKVWRAYGKKYYPKSKSNVPQNLIVPYLQDFIEMVRNKGTFLSSDIWSICDHPITWDMNRREAFFKIVGDMLSSGSASLIKMFKIALNDTKIYDDWQETVESDDGFFCEMKNRGVQDAYGKGINDSFYLGTVSSLVKLIRNTYAHVNDPPNLILKRKWVTREEIDQKTTLLFPNLLTCVNQVIIKGNFLLRFKEARDKAAGVAYPRG